MDDDGFNELLDRVEAGDAEPGLDEISELAEKVGCIDHMAGSAERTFMLLGIDTKSLTALELMTLQGRVHAALQDDRPCSFKMFGGFPRNLQLV